MQLVQDSLRYIDSKSFLEDQLSNRTIDITKQLVQDFKTSSTSYLKEQYRMMLPALTEPDSFAELLHKAS